MRFEHAWLGADRGWNHRIRTDMEATIPMADDMVTDWTDVMFLMVFASFFCLGWPLFALARGFQRTVGRRNAEAFAKALGGMSREERQERRSLRARERAVEIARQERELGFVSDAR